MTDKEWLALHTKEDVIPQSTVAWIASLSPAGQKTIRKFPPSCVVRAKKNRVLQCPAPGRLGTVASVTRDGKQLKIVPSDNDVDTQFAGMCDPKWLEVVGYWRGLTPQKVDAILKALNQ